MQREKAPDQFRAPRAICFDLFNTLVSVGNVPASVGRYTADILGLDQETWNTACFSDAHDITRPTQHEQVIRELAHSLDPSIPLETIRQAAQERQQRFDHALLNIEESVLQNLSALRESGLKLALVSNASTAEVAAWPESPLAEIFHSSVFSCECGMKKPDAGIYHHALQKLDVKVDDAVFVGDGGSQELIGAHHAGLSPILIKLHLKPHRYQSVIEKQGQVIRSEIDDIADLLNWLEL